MEKFNVKVKRVTSWERVVDAARMTMWKGSLGHTPSSEFMEDMCKSEHSPLRLLEYDITLTNIPTKVATHLVRHHEGVEKFVSSNREDRHNTNDEDINRLTPVNMLLSINAQALINISRVRLCSMADRDTRTVWREIRNQVALIDPIVAQYMVTNCVYRCGCPEKNGCGYVNTKQFTDARLKYVKGYGKR